MRRVNRLLNQQPLWHLYVVVVAIGFGVGPARGHSVETAIDNTVFVVIVSAIGDTIRRSPPSGFANTINSSADAIQGNRRVRFRELQSIARPFAGLVVILDMASREVKARKQEEGECALGGRCPSEYAITTNKNNQHNPQHA
jgi:hypothetical protein